MTKTELLALADLLMEDAPLPPELCDCNTCKAAAALREFAGTLGQEPVAWHVCSVNSDGSLSLEFAAPWEELAHEHINDAINEHDIDGATSWVVRPVYTHPPAPQPAVPAPDRYSELAEALGCDCMDSHAGRIARAKRLAEKEKT